MAQLSHRGERGRLICLTHVLPYPPGAGNEYRIHHMLTWLAKQGWDAILIVCPLPNEPVSDERILEAAAVYPNLVLCERDGTVRYRLVDGAKLVHSLRGRRPRSFSTLLHEPSAAEDTVGHELLGHMRTFCPDLLIELLLQVDAEFKPDVLLAEYIFMTRPFPLMRPELKKVVDAHDVFSTKHTKVVRYGVDDSLAITPEAEAELLNRADILIAIQAEEAEALQRLAPEREVIKIGVDFVPIDRTAQLPERPTVLVVASKNGKNIKGVQDFVRFAWPLIRGQVPEAELQVVGDVGETVDPFLPGVRILGRIDDLAEAYAAARVVINPAVAGTGLKIKTVEALCYLRPIVLWPSGVDGLGPELHSLCHLATNWFEFAQRVIDLLRTPEQMQPAIIDAPGLADQFAPDRVYAPLGQALDPRTQTRV